MSTDASPLAATCSPFSLDDDHSLLEAVTGLLSALPRPPEIIALGEPTHGEPAFPAVRNRILGILHEEGVRSVALETDAVAALRVADFVAGGSDPLDDVLATGFSHGLGSLDGSRDLLIRMRDHNRTQPPDRQLTFHGFDAPLEMVRADSPRRYLLATVDYLERHLGEAGLTWSRGELDRLLGDDHRWTDPDAVMDARASVGAGPDALALRAAADDLLTVLRAHAPALVADSSPEDWYRADLHARTARGLLRYHAAAARAAAPARRTSWLLGVRDALMAENLMSIRFRERDRGPTLVFAHNRHLQRHPSTWRLGDMDLEWSGAGAVVATLLGDRYLFIAGSLGASDRLGLTAPAPDTVEGLLQQAAGGRSGLFDTAALRTALPPGINMRSDTAPEQGYFPLDSATLEHCDGVLHLTTSAGGDAVPQPVDVDDLTARIAALPGVEYLVTDERSGAPEVTWGSRFFFVGADRKQPFATVVERDVPGWDEESRLDRPGVYRLNVQLGRDRFERVFGYPPARLPEHLAAIDFTRFDLLLPHPAYGRQGWACILNPTPERLPEIDGLIRQAHARARDRRERRDG